MYLAMYSCIWGYIWGYIWRCIWRCIWKSRCSLAIPTLADLPLNAASPPAISTPSDCHLQRRRSCVPILTMLRFPVRIMSYIVIDQNHLVIPGHGRFLSSKYYATCMPKGFPISLMPVSHCACQGTSWPDTCEMLGGFLGLGNIKHRCQRCKPEIKATTSCRAVCSPSLIPRPSLPLEGL